MRPDEIHPSLIGRHIEVRCARGLKTASVAAATYDAITCADDEDDEFGAPLVRLRPPAFAS
jgi:hypothetical protein